MNTKAIALALAPFAVAGGSCASEAPMARLHEELAGLEILLVGEEHSYLETVRFLCGLLVRTGASAALEAAVRDGDALPLGEALTWAHRNPARVSRVVAMDEDPAASLRTARCCATRATRPALTAFVC